MLRKGSLVERTSRHQAEKNSSMTFLVDIEMLLPTARRTESFPNYLDVPWPLISASPFMQEASLKFVATRPREGSPTSKLDDPTKSSYFKELPGDVPSPRGSCRPIIPEQ